MSDFKRVRAGEDMDPCYGMQVLDMNIGDFVAMQLGCVLYATINEGEYAIVIRVKEDNVND